MKTRTPDISRARRTAARWLRVALCAALIAAAPARAAETITLVNSDSAGSITDRMNAYFKEDLERRSGGELAVNYIPGESFGSAKQVMDQMIAGSVESFGNVLAWFTPYDRDFEILTWGFTFRDNDHMQAFFDGPTFAAMAERVREKHGLRLLAAAPTDARVMYSKKPVLSIADVQGLNIRVPQIRAYLELWQELGATPTQVPWAEVYLALKTGVVEAAEAPPGGAITKRFHEAAPHISLTRHLISTVCFTINEARYQRLSAQHKRWLEESARAAVLWIRRESEGEVQQLLEQMVAEGATIHEIDVAPFQQKAIGAVRRLEEEGLWSPGLWAAIQEL